MKPGHRMRGSAGILLVPMQKGRHFLRYVEIGAIAGEMPALPKTCASHRESKIMR